MSAAPTSSPPVAAVEAAAIVFQRRAAAWLDEIRAAAREEGAATVDCDGLSLDVLDAMRSPLNIENGALLAEGQTALGAGPPAGVLRRVRSRLSAWKYYLKRRVGLPRRAATPGSAEVWLALPRQPAHLFDMLPVARHLRSAYGVETVFGVVDRRLLGRVREERFGVFGLYAAAWLEERRHGSPVRQFRSDLQRLLDRFTPTHEAERHRELAANTRRIVGELLGEVMATASAVRGALRQVRPCGVLLGNPYVFEGRVAGRVAAAEDTPVACIEHGSIFLDDPNWPGSPIDLACVWGEPSRRALLSCGIPERRIQVTGAPRHDQIFLNARQFATPREQRPAILVAGGGPGDNVSLEQHRRFIRTLYAAADLATEVRWTIKLHKRDRLEHYPPPGVGPHPRITVVPNDLTRDGMNIFDYLAKARAVVTVLSTVAVEAMALDLPVISVDVWHPGRPIQGVEFLDRQCTRRVSTAEELARAAEAAWHGEPDHSVDIRAAQYADEHFVNRGRAAVAAADALTALVRAGDPVDAPNSFRRR